MVFRENKPLKAMQANLIWINQRLNMRQFTQESLPKLFTEVNYQTVTLLQCIREIRMCYALSISYTNKNAKVWMMA